VKDAYCPRMKLYTVVSVALGIEVFAAAEGKELDQLAPSFVFNLVGT
jgi:hypothetical protein